MPSIHSGSGRSALLAAVLFLFLAAASPTPGRPSDERQDDAHAWVGAALSAMGGEAQIRALKTMTWKLIGHRYMREQSERPEGPWLLDYFQATQFRDLEHRRLRDERQSRGCDSTECWKSPDWQPSTVVFSDGVAAQTAGENFFPARPEAARNAEESFFLAPEQALLIALSAKDLRAEPPIEFHGFRQQVVSFHYDGKPLRILLNPYTNLPAALEITRPEPDSVFWGPWGDVTTRLVWTFWQLEPGGVHYPRQWDFESNGRPDCTMTINELTLNPPLAAGLFAIPEATAANLRARRRSIEEFPLGRPNTPAVEIAPGVVQMPGSWNITEVRQPDGIVILEGPISNGYSAKVIEDVQKRFPGAPIKAVITTSDAWPHIGGLREYAARGIPIYALDLNRPILTDLFAAPHRTNPDALANNGRKPELREISQKTAIGEGENHLEIIPLRTQSGERQMFVYLPGAKLLYTSDLFQRDPSGAFFLPQTLSEAIDAVHRDKLAVEAAFGMHLSLTPWKEIEAAVTGQVHTAAPH